MKKLLLVLLVLGVVAIAGQRAPLAQTDDPAFVRVSFPFIVGDRLLPAGAYRITSDSQDPSVLYITSLTGKPAAAFTATIWADNPTLKDADVRVAFKNIDGQYFLWRVAMPGTDARVVNLTKAEAEHVLAKLNLMPTERGEPAK